MTQRFFLPIEQNLREQLPHYEDYATVLRMVMQKLNEIKPLPWQFISAEDLISYTVSNVTDLIKEGKIEYQSLGHVYGARPSIKIEQNESVNEFTLRSTETIDNQLLYFPAFDVAMTHLNYYVGTGATWPEYLLIAPSAEHVERWIYELNERQRERMKTTITYLVDTENGIEKRSYGHGEQIEREDVLLDEEMKHDLFRSIDEFFRNDGEFFKEYGLPYKRGILLYGPPGNGKTTLVRSITGTTGAPVIYWQITEHTGSYSVQEVFETVERMAPAILVIEDIDSMPEHTRSTFLNSLDGARVRAGLFIIGTTNYPERIDPALINRAGRFDSTYEISSPTYEIRRKYLQMIDKKQLLSEEQMADLAKKTSDLSVSQLNELYMSIALGYHYDGVIKYDSRIQQLQTQHRRATRNHWESDSSIGF